MGGECTLDARLVRDLEKAANAVRSANTVRIVTHIDADGISSGGIASITLNRLGKDHEVTFEKKMTEEVIGDINDSADDLIWICDLGSAYLSEFKRSGIIITDHHVPDTKLKSRQTSMDDFREIHHLNPHIYGLSGSYEVCGAGMTYLLSKTIDAKNKDLAYLAVVGAVGDLQDNRESRLVSCNRLILEDAVASGDIAIENDVRMYGRDYRPLVQFLQYSNEPVIPGISNNASAAYALFSELKIPLKEDGVSRTWKDLSDEERAAVTERLIGTIEDDSQKRKFFGEVYSVSKYNDHTKLHDAKEFATILNSCGRYDDEITGLRLCMGDLSALGEAEKNRSDHRRNISVALEYVKENRLLRERRFVQYFDAGSKIRETVVGIVAGMLLNSGDARRELPIFAFAETDDGVKVSARASGSLTDRGLDLSFIVKTASEMVGGYGGGHNVAAGATIPNGKEEEFLDIVEDLVSSQII